MSWWDFGGDPHDRPGRNAPPGWRRRSWLRIPWAMAGMSDPSSHQALLPEGHYHVSSVTIPGIGLTVADGTQPDQQLGTVRWHNWQTVRYRERMKPGVPAIHRAFAAVTGPAVPGPAWRPGAAARAAGG